MLDMSTPVCFYWAKKFFSIRYLGLNLTARNGQPCLNKSTVIVTLSLPCPVLEEGVTFKLTSYIAV